MGSNDCRVNTFLYQGSRQCKSLLYCLWPIINAGQDMQMCIDHDLLTVCVSLISSYFSLIERLHLFLDDTIGSDDCANADEQKDGGCCYALSLSSETFPSILRSSQPGEFSGIICKNHKGDHVQEE